MKKEVTILYEDDDMILCHKPAGMATQTKRLGQQDMESFLKNYRVKKGEPPYIGIVHRLDQPVEGIMVFAKNQKATASLSKQIQQRMIGKYYYAVSNNIPTEKQGILENYLLTDKKTNFTKVIDKEDFSQTKHFISDNQFCENKKTDRKNEIQERERKELPKEAKYAKLEYKVLEEKDGKTLFVIKLHTGRQHQIRVQMAYMGCSLVGDSKYGNTQVSSISRDSTEKSIRENLSVSRVKEGLGLCSYQLEFRHPTTGKEMKFSIVPKGDIFQKFNTFK